MQEDSLGANFNVHYYCAGQLRQTELIWIEQFLRQVCGYSGIQDNIAHNPLKFIQSLFSEVTMMAIIDKNGRTGCISVYKEGAKCSSIICNTS